MKKKSVHFDELEGGAIRTDTRMFETATPVQDYTAVLRGAEFAQADGDQNMFFQSAFDMIPRNLQPLFQYNYLMEGENPSYVKDVLLKGLSGSGSHKDPPHIQKAVVHSLKAFPKLLHMYLNSHNLILPS